MTALSGNKREKIRSFRNSSDYRSFYINISFVFSCILEACYMQQQKP